MIDTSNLTVGGVFTCRLFRAGQVIDEWESKNRVVDEGLTYMLEVALQKTANKPSAIGAWYIGLYSGSGYTPAYDDTAANITARSTEFTDYTGNRITWDEADAGASGGGATPVKITNATGTGAVKASFPITVGSPTNVYGAFFVSSSTKSGTSGTLLAASAFGAPRQVSNGDTLEISYSVQMASA